MLFGNKKCTHCGSNYDKALSTCPVCDHDDENFDALKINKHVMWLPFLKQILLFAFGYVGLNILTIIIELFLLPLTALDAVTYYTVVNVGRYGFIAIAMLMLLYNYIPYFKKAFNKLSPYLLGVVGAIILVVSTIVWNYIASSIHPTSDNENQMIADSMISQYPIICLIFLGIVGPLVEEFTFRVGLFNFLLRINKFLAYAVTIVVFAFIHFSFSLSADVMINELLNLPSYLLAAFFLTLWYDKFGLSASITAHVLNNLYSVMISIIFTFIIR